MQRRKGMNNRLSNYYNDDEEDVVLIQHHIILFIRAVLTWLVHKNTRHKAQNTETKR